ncbi:MAG: hypothetical protein K2X27_08865 [Candidatus Obscuribacterales bacterium]|nr:hypothetical protein [Candidatus Obscuribacterales bacterium]
MTGPTNNGGNSLAQCVFNQMSYKDPIFVKLKELLLSGRRSEALQLIRLYDRRFADPEAQELIALLMNTLQDTAIDG